MKIRAIRSLIHLLVACLANWVAPSSLLFARGASYVQNGVTVEEDTPILKVMVRLLCTSREAHVDVSKASRNTRLKMK